MLTGIHILLTYACNYECDHCFLYCSPKSEGTFTIKQIKEVLDDAIKIGTIEWIFFEGGEAFLYYPIMLEGLRMAAERGFKTGIVTNSYWATSVEDAELWLKPLIELKISNLTISDDVYHFGDNYLSKNPAKVAEIAARNLGITEFPLCIVKPTVDDIINKTQDLVFKGRAVEKLIKDLPRRPWDEFTKCYYEKLRQPQRVHLDSFGNTHICQGLSIGNIWEIPLSELIKNYDPDKHPICGPLLNGGPAQLVREYDVEHEDSYVDECHLCYLTRLALIEKFQYYLTPKQVYGLESEKQKNKRDI